MTTFTLASRSLNAGQTTTLTISSAKPLTDIEMSDFVLRGVTLTDLTQVNSGTWTATVHVESGYKGNAYINLLADRYHEGGVNGASKILSLTVDGTADITPPDAHSTQISLDAITADNVVNKAESEQTIDVTGKVTGEFQVGDVVTVTVNDVVYTTQLSADGSYSVAIAGSALVADADNKITASVAASDATGNVNTTGSINTNMTYGVDTVVKGEFVLANFTDSANPYVAGTEKDNITQDNNFDLTVANLEAGASVVYQQLVNGTWQATTAAQSNLADGAYQFRAVITDKADNISTQSVKVTVDTQAEDAPKNVLTEENTITGNATAGTTVILQNASGVTIASTVAKADGSFEFTIPQAQQGADLTVATVDIAGNVSNSVAPGHHYKVYTAAHNWNAEHGAIDYYSYKTTSGSDWIEIGNGDKNCWTYGTQGNIWNPYPWTGYSTIVTGAGDDRIDTGVSGGYGNMYAYTSVDMGSGNDTFNLKGQMYSNSVVEMGTGNDMVSIGGNVHNCAEIYAGKGNDTLTVGEDIDNYAKVLMGTGNDTIIVGEDIEDYAQINMGAGDDVLSVARYVENGAVIDMGDGNNTATMAGLNNWASINFGAGNDSLTITDQFGAGCGSATVSLGAGNDVFTYGGKTLDGTVNGGSGHDTIVLTQQQDNFATTGWNHVTNLDSNNFTGFEVVKLEGNNALDIRFSDLMQDNARDGALFVQGDSSSKVDLGSTDWNSDNDTNLTDNSAGNWWQSGSWSKASTETVDGITYDVYHHSYASDVSNDVYIQQGVVVI